MDLATVRWRSIAIIAIAILVAFVTLAAAGFSINWGPSMSHLGWFYRTQWGTLPTHIGQIVRFSTPDQPLWRKYIWPSIKRVTKITKEGYWVEGDNDEYSKDSRDWYRVVSVNNIAGVVTWCWSPIRYLRSFNESGKLLNDLSFKYPPRDIFLYSEFIVVSQKITNSKDYSMNVWKLDGTNIFTTVFPGPGAPLGWRNEQFIFIQGMDEFHEVLWVYTPPKRLNHMPREQYQTR